MLCKLAHIMCFHAGIEKQEMKSGMKIASISVALCQLVARLSLIGGFSRSLISLVVSLVFNETETDPVAD